MIIHEDVRKRRDKINDYTGKILNLLEDFKKVDIFTQIVGPTRYSDGYSDIYSDVKK